MSAYVGSSKNLKDLKGPAPSKATLAVSSHGPSSTWVACLDRGFGVWMKGEGWRVKGQG